MISILSLLFRLALEYKRLPYETQWVEVPDIATLCRNLGVKPNEVPPEYIVPAILDSTRSLNSVTKSTPLTAVMDSTQIAQYLDETYPERKLFRASAEGQKAQNEFLDFAWSKIIRLECLVGLMLSPMYKRLSPPSAEHYRQTREARYGIEVPNYAAAGSKLEASRWENVEKAFDEIFQQLKVAERKTPDILQIMNEEGERAPTYTALVMQVFALGSE